jgi:hypothetical protein
MTKRKKPHSKQRRKFQEAFIDLCVHSMSAIDLIEYWKATSRTSLGRLSDEEFVKHIQDPIVDWENVYHIQQWDKYIEFVEYIKEKQNEKN